MKIPVFLLTVLLFLSCQKEHNPAIQVSGNTSEKEIVVKLNITPKINRDKNTVRTRFDAPEGFRWKESAPNSYGHFIENFKLKDYGSPIIKFNGERIGNQTLHEAIFDIDVGDKDLQQCADAIIRLHSEYLFKTKKFGEIKYHFTSGHLLSWNDYKNGTRAIVSGNSVSFRNSAQPDDSYANFRNYLNLIYTYAGTISQFKETKPVTENSDLQTGDILITAGSPGHVVFIAGVSENKDGEKRYLLAEGFTPAQSISLMKNPFNPTISPWYELDVNASEIHTARYHFTPVNFRRY